MKRIISIVMLCLLLASNCLTTYAHTHDTVEANDSLNRIIEEEVKQNTFNEIQPKVGVQIKNYTSTTVTEKRVLKGAYGAAYATGTSISKTVSVTINQGAQFKTDLGKTISIGVSVSKSATATINGPDYTTKVPGSTLNATHAVAIAILKGSIVHETFDYCDATTGELISHVDRYVIGDPTVVRYNLLVADTATGYHVGHCAESKFKTFSDADAFKAVINSTNPIPAYSW